MVSSGSRYNRVTVAMFLAVSAGGVFAQAAPDEYESLLDAEVQKVEARQIDGAAGKNDVTTPAALGGSAPVVGDKLPRTDFDNMLKSQHKGIFTFYKHLPERSRQEVYAEYLGGASIPELRTKTLDRFKQR